MGKERKRGRGGKPEPAGVDPGIASLQQAIKYGSDPMQAVLKRQEEKEAARPAVGSLMPHRDVASFSVLEGIQELDVKKAPAMVENIFTQGGLLSTTPPQTGKLFN